MASNRFAESIPLRNRMLSALGYFEKHVSRPAMRPSIPRLSMCTLLAALALAGCLGPNAEKSAARAELASAQGDAATASIEAKNAVQAAPESAANRLLLARMLLGEGDAAGAQTELDRAQRLGAPEHQLAPLQAALSVARGRPREVIERWRNTRFAEQPQATARLLVEVARARLQNGQEALALEAAEQALALAADHHAALVLAARLRAATGDRPGALQRLEAALAGLGAAADPATAAPDLPAARARGDAAQVLLALAEIESQDPALSAQARQRWQRALALAPKDPQAHASAIAAALREGDRAAALKLHAEMAKALPGQAMTLYQEALLAFAGNDFANAAAVSDRLVGRIDGSPSLLLLAGMSQARIGSPARAEAMLLRAAALQPAWPEPRLELAALRMAANQPQRAIEELRPVLGNAAPPMAGAAAGSGASAPPDTGLEPDPRVLGVAAQALARLGRFDEADRLFARAAERSPDAVALRTAAAKSQIARGQFEVGLRELQAAAAADTGGVGADLALVAAQMKRGDRAAALKAVVAIEQKAPTAALAPLLRGRIAESTGDRSAAAQAYAQALEREPGSVQAIAALSGLDLAAGQGAAAQRRWEALAKRDPKSAPAHLALAELALRDAASTADIQAHLDRAAQAAPQDPQNWRAVIDLQRRTSSPAAVLARAQAAAAALPNDTTLLLDLAGAQNQTGDVQAALSTLRQITALIPADAEAQLRLALAHITSGQPAAGKPALAKALELSPLWPAALRTQIAVAVAEGQVERALATAREVQKAAPERGLGWQLEGEIETTRARRDAAVAAFRTALQRQASSDVAIQLHQALLGNRTTPGDAAAAAAFEAQWLKSQPRDALFLGWLGAAAKQIGRLPEAERRYREALAIQPDDPLLLNNLAYLLTETDRAAEALKLAQRAQQIAPHMPAVLDTLATALARNKQFREAVAWQRRAVERAPADEALRLHLANLLLAAEQKDPAKEELRAIVRGLGRPAAAGSPSPAPTPIQRVASETLARLGG
jgi:tetratricopeptide (TPR) repeat protein